jgi:hypothetical protein
MNRPFGVPALAGPDLPAPGLRQAGRPKAGLQTRGVPTESSVTGPSRNSQSLPKMEERNPCPFGTLQ